MSINGYSARKIRKDRYFKGPEKFLYKCRTVKHVLGCNKQDICSAEEHSYLRRNEMPIDLHFDIDQNDKHD